MNITLVAKVRAAANRDGGIGTDDLPGHSRKAVRNAVRGLLERGEIHRVELGRDPCGFLRVRYVATVEQALALDPAYVPPAPRKREGSTPWARTTTRRPVAVSGPPRAWWSPDAPVVIPPDVKITRCPPLPDPARTNTHGRGW